jgi:hypothetical protein
VGLGTAPTTTPVGFYDGVNLNRSNNQVFHSFSPIGAYDMAGNADEWVHDRYDLYTSSSKTDPTGPASGTTRIVRGGNWDFKGGALRTASRRSVTAPSTRDFRIGFRVAAVREHVPLSITAAVAHGETTSIATQTITFTFGEEVVGFNIDDIQVGNGSLSNFTTASADSYSVDVTATVPGAVTIGVATGAATGPGGVPSGAFQFVYYFEELLEFVSVPAGTFTMGRTASGDDAIANRSDELPNHQVTLSAYDIGKFEVTNAEFATVMNWALARGISRMIPPALLTPALAMSI